MARHPVDVHVGARLRQLRILLGMSQSALGNAAGMTHQQVQRFEAGDNPISSSRLLEFAKILDVPVSHFFEEMAPEVTTDRCKAARPKSNASNEPINLKGETLELVRAYYKIENDDVCQKIHSMVRALASEG